MNLPWPTSTYIIFNSLGSSGCWQPMNTASYIHFNWNTIDFLFTHLIKNNNNKRKHELVWSKKQLNSDLKSYMTNRQSQCGLCSGVEARCQRWILLQSGQWCECSPQSWHLPTVSHSVLSSWVRSVPTYLKTRLHNENSQWETLQRRRCSRKKNTSFSFSKRYRIKLNR